MFTSEGNIEYICQPDVKNFGDGIFKYCPRYFYQLYIPCMDTKTGVMFHVCSFCFLQNQVNIHLDFEDVVFEAARVFWSTVIIKGVSLSLTPSLVAENTKSWPSYRIQK